MVGRDQSLRDVARARRPSEIAAVSPNPARRAVICFAFIALLTSEMLKAQSASASATEPESSALDVKGIRHRPSDYGDKSAPWMADRVKFVQPNYPAEARARHIEGTGLFRITLNVNTGSVTNVAVIKSTGSSGLDDAAMRAIRLWRWRPQRWKAIDMPLTFTMRPRPRDGASDRERTSRGTAYYRKGHNASAIKAYDEAIRLEPRSVEAYIMRGSAYQAEGQRDKALADLNRAIQLDPKSARAYCDRAVLEDELLQQPDKALADYNEAIRLAPDFHRAYFNRAVHFLGRHDYAHAIADFSRAIQLMPSDGSAYAYRAYAQAKQGDRARALADAKVAVRLKPGELPIARVTDLDLRAKAYRIIGQPELALRDFREAVRVMSNHYTANDNLAWFLATCSEKRFRNGTEAVSTAKKACELSQWKSFGCYDTLAAAYAEAGDFDQAVKYEKHALDDSSVSSKEREEREKRLALFEHKKPFREEF
jgi:TonB family protein